MENKREHKRKKLLKFCEGTYFPVRLKSGMWVVNTEHGLEYGDISYVAGEFSGDGLSYHYKINGEKDHEHYFGDVIERLVQNLETFSVEGFEEEYSAQELKFLKSIQEAYKTVGERNAPLTSEEKLQKLKMKHKY